jgi:REP element-mobilizing transposase RayT
MSYDDLRKGRCSEAHRAYFITTVLAQREQRLFADLSLARVVISEMRRLHAAEALHSLTWVVMPDHVHWLFQLGDLVTLSTAMKAFKARSAQRLNQKLGRSGPIWQKAYYDHALRGDEDIQGIARYIVGNPLRAGLVDRIGDYPHWDAVWL